jgi:PTH2 family peptidyl-tRNA hydrolase
MDNKLENSHTNRSLQEPTEQNESRGKQEIDKSNSSLYVDAGQSASLSNKGIVSHSSPPRSYTLDVNPIFLDNLMEMGFPENRAKKALILTGNVSIEMAMNWLLEHIDDTEVDNPVSERPIGTHSVPLSPRPNIFSADLLMQTLFPKSTVSEHKLVLCVRDDLKMGVGKIAAQCCHATLGIYKRMKQNCPGLLSEWEKNGEKKVVLRVHNLETLNALENKAIALNLPTHKVCDAGRTQIPEGTTTVLAIAGPENIVDQVTGHLKLL